MSTNDSKPKYRGLVVPDPRITGTVWEEESSYTETGAQPGIPATGRDTELALRAHGTPEDDAAPLDIELCRNGFPARDLGARMAIRREDIPAEEWRDHWAPQLWSMRETVENTTVTAVLVHDAPDVAAIPGGGVLAVWADDNNNLTATVRAGHRDADGVWSIVDVLTVPKALPDTMPLSCVEVLPSGRALLLTWNLEVGSFDLYVSDDNGATWLKSAVSVIPPLDEARFTLKRCRMAYGGPGEILLLLWLLDNGTGVPWSPLSEDVLYNYASSDLASSFVLVDFQDGLGTKNVDADDPDPQTDWIRSAGYPDVISDRAGFAVVYAEPNLGNRPSMRRLASAYSSFRAAPASWISNRPCATGTPEYTDGDVAGTADLNGTLWVMFRDPDATTREPLSMAYSNDTGGRWRDAPNTGGDFAVFDSGIQARLDLSGTGETLGRLASCWDRGRLVLLHAYTDTVAAIWRQGLHAYLCGGWNAPTALVDARAALPGELGSQGPNYARFVPMLQPAAVGYSAGAGNTGTGLVDGAVLAVTNAAAGQQMYFLNSGSQAALTALLDCKVATGGTGCTVSAGGTAAFDTVTISAHVLASGSVEVWHDLGAPLLLASVAVGVAGDRLQVALGVSIHEGTNIPKAGVWARTLGAAGLEYDPPWVLIYEGSPPVDGGAQAVSFVRFGNLLAITTANTADIYEFSHRWSVQGGNANNPAHWAEGRLPATSLQGRALTVIPEHALEGVYLSAVGGPGFTGDTWRHEVLHDFGAENLAPLAVRSPSQGWEASGGNGTVESVAWDLTDGLTLTTHLETPVLAVHVVDTNCPVWKIQGYDQFNTSWVDLASFDVRDSFGTISCDVRGSVALVLGANPAPTDAPGGFYVSDTELLGGHIWGPDGEIGFPGPFEILGNTGGIVSPTLDEAGTRTPRIRFNGVNSTVPDTVDCRIMPKSFTVLVRVDGLGVSEAYRGYRIVMDATAVDVAGNLRAAKVVLGAAYLFGLQWDLSKSYQRRSAVDVDQDAGGQVHTRVRGPTRRLLSVRWQQGGVWTAGAYAADDPFVTFSTAVDAWPVSLLHDVPMMLDGLQERLNGIHTPVVVLQDLPRLVDPATYVVLARNRASGALYSHLLNDLSFGVDAGTYATGERFTLAFDVEEEA